MGGSSLRRVEAWLLFRMMGAVSCLHSWQPSSMHVSWRGQVQEERARLVVSLRLTGNLCDSGFLVASAFFLFHTAHFGRDIAPCLARLDSGGRKEVDI